MNKFDKAVQDVEWKGKESLNKHLLDAYKQAYQDGHTGACGLLVKTFNAIGTSTITGSQAAHLIFEVKKYEVFPVDKEKNNE
jgi:hypothetical protein